MGRALNARQAQGRRRWRIRGSAGGHRNAPFHRQRGPTIAERIIDGRPWEDVDALIDVNGIGEVTLGEIVEEGQAAWTAHPLRVLTPFWRAGFQAVSVWDLTSLPTTTARRAPPPHPRRFHERVVVVHPHRPDRVAPDDESGSAR